MTPLHVLYMGTPHFAVPPLQALLDSSHYKVCGVITQPDAQAGRGKKIKTPPVKDIALLHSIPLLQPTNIRKNWSDVATFLDSIQPLDVAVVCAFGQILPISLLNYPTYGSINIHASILPRWRGAAPIHRAIMHGDTQTGITLMQMDEGLDTGDWYLNKSINILETDTTGKLHDTLSELGAKLLVDNLTAITEQKFPPIKQDATTATYAKKVKKSECRINWEQNSAQVLQQIRGLSPFPGAFTTYRDKRLKIYNVSQTEIFHGDTSEEPGTICHIDSSRLEISCKEGVISLLEVQMEGKAKLPISDFLKGCSFSKGDRFQ